MLPATTSNIAKIFAKNQKAVKMETGLLPVLASLSPLSLLVCVALLLSQHVHICAIIIMTLMLFEPFLYVLFSFCNCAEFRHICGQSFPAKVDEEMICKCAGLLQLLLLLLLLLFLIEQPD